MSNTSAIMTDGSIMVDIMQSNLESVVKKINSGSGVNEKNSAWGSMLHCAAYCGDKNIVKFLIECGADVNSTYSGWTPLDATLIKILSKKYTTFNNYEIAKILIDNGAKLNLQASK